MPHRPGDAEAAGGFDHGIKAHFLQQLHRNHVEGVLHCHPHRDAAHVAVAEVFRAIAGKTAGLIHHDVFRFHALFEGREINKQLEGGPGGAQGLDGPVELALVVILATHEGPHQAGAGLHRDQGALHGPRRVGINDLLGVVLPGQIEAAADRQAAHLQLLGREHLGQLLGHPAGEVGGAAVPVLGHGRFEFQGCGQGLRLLAIVDEAGFAHAPEHDPAPLQG